MKKSSIFLSLLVLFALSITNTAFAQLDDLYYNPADEAKITTTTNDNNYEQIANDNAECTYVAADYDDYAYDYYYSSRVRRFNRANVTRGYYDSYYTDTYWYGAFTPGNNIYLTNGNGWYGGYGNVGFYSPNVSVWGPAYQVGWNPWNASFGNGYGQSYYGVGGASYGGFNNSACTYNTNTVVPNTDTYYSGPRPNTTADTYNTPSTVGTTKPGLGKPSRPTINNPGDSRDTAPAPTVYIPHRKPTTTRPTVKDKLNDFLKGKSTYKPNPRATSRPDYQRPSSRPSNKTIDRSGSSNRPTYSRPSSSGSSSRGSSSRSGSSSRGGSSRGF